MTILLESNFEDVQVITEQESDGKRWYLEGIFLQADVVNRNRRVYPYSVMKEQVDEYNKEWVQQNRAVGELSHPENVEINLDKITHLVESIREEGKNFIGRAKVLNTPCGKIVEGLLEGGVRLGVSSRATGSLKNGRNGINEVQDDFKLKAIDIVYHPSAPDAMVDGIMEGADFIWDTMKEDTEFVENIRESLDKGKAYKSEEQRFQAFCEMMNRISGKV